MRQAIFCGILLPSLAHVLANPVPNELKSATSVTAYCRDGYSQPVDSNWPLCYKIYTTEYEHRQEAIDKCKSDGGNLASVPNAFVNSYLCSIGDEMNIPDFSLGIQCHNKTSCFNDDGTEFRYSNFVPDASIDDYKNSNVYMVLKQVNSPVTDRHKWRPHSNNAGVNFVCEIPAGVVHEFTCPKGYTNFEGLCYKFFETQSISANSASAACRTIPGGNLAIVNTEEINMFLEGLDPQVLIQNYAAFGLRCYLAPDDIDPRGCKWDDGSLYAFNAFKRGWPGQGAHGCCDFNGGKWSYCYDCDNTLFKSYICQAPEQQISI